MPARYPPIDRLAPIEVRLAEADPTLKVGPAAPPSAGGRGGVALPARRPLSSPPPLEGRLAGLDAFRGLVLLLFAWAVLLPMPLGTLLGGEPLEPTRAWAGPAMTLLADLRAGAFALPWNTPPAAWVPSLLLAAVLVAAGAGIPLAAARRARSVAVGRGWKEGDRRGLLASLPHRFATLVLVAVLVPLMRPENLSFGASSALSLLAILGLVPLTLRFGPEVSRAGRWTLRGGGLGICLLVLCLRIDVSATRADAWMPDPVVLLIAWTSLLAALFWLVTPGCNPFTWCLRLAMGLMASFALYWVPAVLELAGLQSWAGTSFWRDHGLGGFALERWFFPPWLLGVGLVTVGTVVGDLGVRHLRDTLPPPAGALSRDDPEEVRWGAGGVLLMAVLLFAAPAMGIAMPKPLLFVFDTVPWLNLVPAATIAAAVAVAPVLLARFLMIGRTDAAGRWVRSLATLAAVLLLAAVTAGAAAVALGPLEMPAGDPSDMDLLRALAVMLVTTLGLGGGLVAVLAGLSAPLDRPHPVIPLVLALPLTGVGRNPLLLYALLAGPVLVLFGHPWVPVSPEGATWASIDTWVAFVIVEFWGEHASPVHGIGYALLKALAIAMPAAALARAGVVLRA